MHGDARFVGAAEVRSVHGGLTHWVGGVVATAGCAPQLSQLAILERSRDRLGALHADLVAAEPANKWPRGGMSEVFMGG